MPDLRRWRVLVRLQQWTEIPLLVLALVWVALLIYEFTQGLIPWMERLGLIIWAVFIFDFLLKLGLAPDRLLFVRRNLLTVVALVIPALRVFRVFQAVRILRLARITRGIRLVRVASSLNRAVRSLGHLLSRRGIGFAMVLTLLVVLVSAAALMSFESGTRQFSSYGESVWWTTMLVLTIGNADGPTSTEGRILTVGLAIYGFSILGYVTATLASYFLETSREQPNEQILAEVRALREAIEMRGGLS